MSGSDVVFTASLSVISCHELLVDDVISRKRSLTLTTYFLFSTNHRFPPMNVPTTLSVLKTDQLTVSA